ncbi:Peptide (Neuropeptide FF/F/Y) G protein-coupled receptor [Schistosoma japonicum]|nr:Peptide (Neuropeptide FF/F/Y) G protein-coupled receptor [Schistosoma japonicum]
MHTELYGHIYYRLLTRRFRKDFVERKRRTNKILIRIVTYFVLCWTSWTDFSLWFKMLAYEVQKHPLALNFHYTQQEHKLTHLKIYNHSHNTSNTDTKLYTSYKRIVVFALLKHLHGLYINRKTQHFDSDKMVNSVQQREDRSMMFLINKLRNIDIEEEEESEIKENPKLGAYIFHCFGFICTCYLSLKSFQQTMNLLYTKQKNDSESCLTKLLTKLINEYSEHSVFGNVIADLVRQNRRCGLKNRNGPLGGNTISDTVHYHKKPTDTNSSTDKHERPIEDSPQPKSSYAKFRRRTSSYISETSFGTISYLDPSTKQTSLFQVSSILLTFRGSVVNTSSQTSLNENKKNEYSEQQHQQKPCDIQMPSILRFIHEYIKDSLLSASFIFENFYIKGFAILARFRFDEI